MSVIFHFVDDQQSSGQNLQFIQAELYERLKEFSEQIKEDGVFLQSPLKALSQYVIDEVIVGNNYLAFRLDDGRVCRTSFTIKTEKVNLKQDRVQRRLSKTAVEKLVHFGGSSNPSRTSLGSTTEPSQTKGFVSNRSAEVSQSVIGGANTARNSLPHRIARYQMLSSTHSAPRVNFIREMQRQGIYFARTFNSPIAASEVPEDLIEQCQTVLQGKSRQLITRELQRTNLDVNMAVNNLLSRDDEAEENGGASAPDDWEETDDLLSLLDHAENPLLEAAVTDNNLGIPEDIFPSIRLRRESLYSSMASDIESFADRRKRRRLDCQLRSSVDSLPRSFVDTTYTPRSGTDSPTFTAEEPPKVETNIVKKNCLALGSNLEFWKEKSNSSGKGKDLKFIKISGMYSELVGVTVDNELHQWRWLDSEPWSSIATELSATTILQGNSYWNNNLSNGGAYFHPRIPSLNLIGEKIIKLNCCSSRATVLTASGKFATWVDETIAPIFQVLRNSDLNYTTQNLKIEHPMTQFSELKDENISDIYTSSLVSAVRCYSGNIFWWGVIPFKYRKSAMEKNRDRNPKRSMKHEGTNKQNKKEASNINPGSFVCMRNAPIFHSGAIGFTVVGGIPKVGTLLEDAWKIEDICRFSVKPVQTLVNERRNSMPNSAPSINPASFDPLTHAHMCPQMNTSFLYGLLGSSNNKTVTNISEGNQNSNDSIMAQCSNNSSVTYKTPTYWAEMPPPPSPASSTCSDQSGPVKISPGTFKRKKHSVSTSGDLISEVNTESRPPILSSNSNRSSKVRSCESEKLSIITSTNLDYEPSHGHKRPLTPEDKVNGSGTSLLNQQQEEEEDWCLKDVIFLEDGRTQPVGVVLKVDGSIAAVKFLKDSERACVAVNCPYSPLTAVFGQSINQSCTEPSMISNTSNSPDPISWLNDCRLLRKEELVVVKQPLVSRVPDVVQKYPKCIPLESCLETKQVSGSSSSSILGMALENELIHLFLRKKNSSKFIEYKLISLGRKVISSHRLSTPINGFLGKSSDSCLISGPLESDYCELKHGSIFNAERHRPIFVRDGNGTVYPMLFKDTQISSSTFSKSEPILNPHWLDLPPVRCVDFGFVTVTTNNNINKVSNNTTATNGNVESTKGSKNKVNRLLIGVLVLESQTLMHHILRADDKKVLIKVANVLESFAILGDQDSLLQKIINEKLDGQRNILHVAVHMCQSVSNVESEWKLASILSYRSRKSSIVSNAEDLSHRSNWSLEHAANMSSSLSYRRWIDMGRPMSDNAIFNYSRSSDKQPSNVRFTVMSSATPSRNSYQDGEVNAGWFLPPVHLDEKEKRSNSYRIINILVNQPSMDVHLITLLSQRNADGETPFMQAIAQRIYSVALFFFDCIFDLCNTQYVSVQNPKNELALNMIYPCASHNLSSKSYLNSFFDDSPLQILCQNDGCSFTWTGPDHIRQDIFECRTCGLTESLCCCTECARVCHKGHDCHLKKTSPTAYCDCWEKCRCKALIVGDSVARQELLKKLLQHTDLSTLPNRRKEHILLFLVKTVDRQFREHKQARNSSRRHVTSVLNNRHGTINSVSGLTSQIGSLEPHHPAFEPPMPEYGLEPSNFALVALDAALSNWVSIETLFLLGEKSDWMNNILNMTDKTKESSGMNPVTDDDAFLNYQSFSEQLDQFVFTLISKTPSSSVDILLKTLNQELQNEKSQCSNMKPNHQTKVKRVASRLIRSVTRVYVALQLQMAPDYNRKRQSNRLSNSGHIYAAQSRPLEVCKKIFENLLFISLSELPRIAADIIAPVRCGLLKPTTDFSHLYQIADAVKNLDHVFQRSHCETALLNDSGDLTTQGNTKQTTQTNRSSVPPLTSNSRNNSNIISHTTNNDPSIANTDSNTSHGIDSSNFHSSSSSSNPNRGYRRRPHNDDDPDSGSGAIPISIDSVGRNSDSAPPARRRRQSTPISLSSRIHALIDEEDDEDGHSSGEENWTSNREVRSNSEERLHSNQLNSIYLEESDGDGNTIEGENDIDGDVDMEVYDDDHDTDIVPETESDSDDSISSSICVTEYNSEPVVVEASSIVEPRNNNTIVQSISTSDSDIRVKDERNIQMNVNTENGSYMTSRECILKSYLDVPLTESISLRKSSGIYDNDVHEPSIIPNDEALRYSISLNIDETRNTLANNHPASLENTLVTSSSEIPTSINNPPEWFGNQVDLDAISDDESEEDSSQNTDDDDRDELNESATDLSQTVLHQRASHTLVHEATAHVDIQGSTSTTGTTHAATINCGLQTTQAQLARSFCCLIKLLAGLLNQMYYSREKNLSNTANNQKEYDRIGLNLGPDIEYNSNVETYATLSQSEEEYILLECSQQLGPIWIWICQSMDFLESQVCFAMAHQRKNGTFKASPVLTFDNIFASSTVLPTTSQTSSTSTDSNRYDFLKYVVSMMRASSDEHGDQVPISLFSVNYCHIAYLVDALLYLMRICFGMVTDKICCDGVDPSSPVHVPNPIDENTSVDNMKTEPTLVQEEIEEEQEDLNSLRPTIGSECDDSILDEDTSCPTLICNYNLSSGPYGSTLLKPQVNHRRDCQQKVDTSEDIFFSRTDYPQGWVGLGANPFQTTVSDALPLAHMPQLLQPPGPSDEVFGILRRFEVDVSNTSPNFCGRSNEGQLPLHMGFSSRWADRLLDNNIIFSGVPVGNLRTRWRYSLEFLSNTFEQSVGLEPDSILVNFTHFSLKETRFRKEMEKLRNQCRRDLSLVVNRDRSSIICDTATQLNAEFSRRNSNNTNIPLICHRFKVKFNDEPGEGNGVARSFLTVFAEAVLSDEPLSMNHISNKIVQPILASRGSIYSRNEHNYIRMSAISRISAPSSTNITQSVSSLQTSNWQDDALSVLGLGYNPISSVSRNYRPTMRIVPTTQVSQSNVVNNRSIIRSDLTSTAQRLISAIAIFASSAPVTTTDISNSLVWGITSPSNINNVSSPSNGITSSYSHYSIDNQAGALNAYVPEMSDMSYSQFSRSDRGMNIRVFPRSLPSNISSYVPTSISFNSSTINANPPSYSSLAIQQFRDIPANPEVLPSQSGTMNNRDVNATSLSQLGNLDSLNIASGFTANLGNQAPIWVSSNWLPMSSNATSISSPISSLGNFRRLTPYSPSNISVTNRYFDPNAANYSNATPLSNNSQIGQNLNLYDMLRNKISQNDPITLQSGVNRSGESSTSISNITNSVTLPPSNISIYEVLRSKIPGDDSLIQQMAYNLSIISGRSDLNGLLSQLSAKILNINDIISNLMNSTAQISRLSISQQMDSPGSTINMERSLETNQALDINVEVSILTFAIYLESLMTTSSSPDNISKPPPEVSDISLDSSMSTPINRCPVIEPEQTPLFWQPGHSGFYAPRRVNITDNNFEYARNNVYRSVGRIIGLSLLMNETMPLKLSRHVLKYILGLPIGWHDFAFYNSQLYESLRQLMQVGLEAQSVGIAGTPQDPLLEYNLNFTITPREEEGASTLTTNERKASPNVINLIPNGEEVDVDSNNVFQYVKKYAITRMIAIVKVQLDQIKLGVYDVLPKNALSGLSPEDLRLLFNGTDDINIDVLMTYTSFLDESSVTISNSQARVSKFKKWFWSVVKCFNAIQRQNLLYFWTSSPSLPASDQGFQPMPSITIRPADDLHLPTANTCISRLYIPLYSSKMILKDKLLQAIETKSFGFV